MKANLKFWAVLLCAGLALVGCCDDPITPENPDTDDDNPIVEQPLTDGSLFTLQLNNDIMATAGENPWNDITYGNGKYVAVGYIPITENNIVTRYGQIAYSSDGVSWTTKRIDAKELEGVCYGGGKFVAVGPNSIAYSTNGIDWYNVSLTGAWGSVAYGNGKFVAAEDNSSKSSVAYSSDGINWETNEVLGEDEKCGGICYGDGNFVICGYRRFYTSSNGVSWDSAVWGAGTISVSNSIAYGNGKFVAIRSNGIRYSTDLQKWTDVSVKVLSFSPSLWTDIAYKDGVGFVMVSRDSDIAISSDGINWSFVDSGASEDFNCVCIMQ